MKSMLPLLLLLSLTTALAGSNPGPCGPPLFKCSRTDNAMGDTPLPPPAKVGTGFSGSTARATRDTTLQSGRIVRCTDGDFLASSGTLNGITFQAGAGGSAEARMWSIDHVLINVADSQAGYTPSTFRGFGVTGLACGRLYKDNPSYSSTGGLRVGSAQFSPTNPRWGLRASRRPFSATVDL